MKKFDVDPLRLRLAVYSGRLTGKFLVGLGIYFSALVCSQWISMIGSPSITTQSQLETLVETERRKIRHSDGLNIFAELVEDDEGLSFKTDENTYKIEIGGYCSNESILKHELYHILDGHCDDTKDADHTLKRIAKYLFWHEPEAVVYQITGLKL